MGRFPIAVVAYNHKTLKEYMGGDVMENDGAGLSNRIPLRSKAWMGRFPAAGVACNRKTLMTNTS